MEVVVPSSVVRRVPGILVRRRAGLDAVEYRAVAGIPITDPVSTLVDLATCVNLGQLEALVNEADRLDLIDPEALRSSLETRPSRPGAGPLRRLLDRQTFRRTDSGLERRFLRLAEAAGLPIPDTQVDLNGFRVDFYWPQLGLVVEVDGVRYHRTTDQQTTDLQRDQVHAAAGMTPLRFGEGQVRAEPARVQATLTAVAQRLSPPTEAFSDL